jgi:transcriptional regulator with XRE-family HTH domain
MQSSDDRVQQHGTGVPYFSAVRKRTNGTIMPMTASKRRATNPGMSPRSSAYSADGVRAAVKAAMERHGTNATAIAKRAGFGARTLGKFLEPGEQQSRSPSLEIMVLVAREMGITVSELIGETAPSSAEDAPELDVLDVQALRDTAFQQAARIDQLYDRLARRPRRR